MLKKSTLLILFISFLTAPAIINAQQISFSRAWILLQEKNNSLAAKQANVEYFQQLQEADESLNFPSITLGANYTRLDNDITLSGNQIQESLSVGQGFDLGALGDVTSTITDKDIFSSSIRALWPIYTGGKITAAHAYAEGRSNEAIAKLKIEKQARYDDLSQYYYSVVLVKEVVETYKSVEKGLMQHRDFSIKLEQQGQIAKVELLQAEASLAKAVVDRKKSERDLDITTSALTEILNQNHNVIPLSPLFINRSLPPISSFTEQTLLNYPGLDLLNAKEEQANSLISAEDSRYLPDVFLYGDYSLYEGDSLSSQLKPDWFVGVGISVPLYDNSGRSSKVKAAHSSLLEVRHLYLQAKQDLTVLVKKTYFEAQQAIEEVQGLDSSLALAKENLRLRKKAFNQGLSVSVEVVDAELFLASIKIQQQVAKYNYIIALNKLLALSNEINTFDQYELTAI